MACLPEYGRSPRLTHGVPSRRSIVLRRAWHIGLVLLRAWPQMIEKFRPALTQGIYSGSPLRCERPDTTTMILGSMGPASRATCSSSTRSLLRRRRDDVVRACGFVPIVLASCRMSGAHGQDDASGGSVLTVALGDSGPGDNRSDSEPLALAQFACRSRRLCSVLRSEIVPDGSRGRAVVEVLVRPAGSVNPPAVSTDELWLFATNALGRQGQLLVRSSALIGLSEPFPSHWEMANDRLSYQFDGSGAPSTGSERTLHRRSTSGRFRCSVNRINIGLV